MNNNQSIRATAAVPAAKDNFRLGPRIAIASLLAVLLIGGAGGWAATAKLAGAVISQGVVIVDQKVKSIQHRDGGIVSDIAVVEGDRVEKGQILLRLDDAQTKAERLIVKAQLVELTARYARLQAEREGDDAITFPVGFLESDPAAPEIAQGAVRLFEGLRAGRESQQAQLRLGMEQIAAEIVGLEGQLSAKRAEIELVEAEFTKIKDLADRQLVEATRVYSTDRERVRLRGELGEIDAAIARARTRSSEISLQILSIDETSRTDAQREIGTLETRLSELRERATAIDDRLTRTDIRAPISGTVNELNVHTVGGVITPAEVLVTIVPELAKLKVEVRLPPVSIEQVSEGQIARLRFPAFNQRTTPELVSEVTYVAPATTRDNKTGEEYYLGYVEIPAGELSKLGDSSLLPGMPVEVFISTDERTVVSYLARPVLDQFSRAFRER